MKRFIPLIIFIAVIASGVKGYNYYLSKTSTSTETAEKTPANETRPSPTTSVKSTDVMRPDSKNPNPMIIDVSKKYEAVLSTSVGDITIELSAAKTPITVNNFVTLAKKGFYANTVFHRVIKDFMVQGGDPKGNGTGGPGYKFDDEVFDGEYTRGTVAMANSGPNTNGSQFFIMHQDYPLPKNYVIFGKVTEGLETIDKIANALTKPNPYSGEQSIPVVPVAIRSIEVTEK